MLPQSFRIYLQDYQVRLRLQFQYQLLLQYFITIGIDINEHQDKGSLHCHHSNPILNSQQATMQKTSFEDRNVKRIPFAHRFAAASSRDPLDFECCLHIVLLIHLNREKYWQLPCTYCHPTLGQHQYHLPNNWYWYVFNYHWHFLIG